MSARVLQLSERPRIRPRLTFWLGLLTGSAISAIIAAAVIIAVLGP